MVVDLPAPFGPRNPSTSPCRTVRSTPATAAIGPKRLVSPLISIMGKVAGGLGAALIEKLTGPRKSARRYYLFRHAAGPRPARLEPDKRAHGLPGADATHCEGSQRHQGEEHRDLFDEIGANPAPRRCGRGFPSPRQGIASPPPPETPRSGRRAAWPRGSGIRSGCRAPQGRCASAPLSRSAHAGRG